jgi:hypothetical protein
MPLRCRAYLVFNLLRDKINFATELRIITFALDFGNQTRLNHVVEKYRAFVSFLFLVLFIRLMVPEAAVLALHQHEHTIENPADDAKVGIKHHHCHVDDLYSADFTSPSVSFELKVNPAEVSYVQPYSFAWKFTYPNNTFQRGPPTV